MGNGDGKCDFFDDCKKDKETAANFKGTVLTKLESIESYMKDQKEDGKDALKDVWEAISSVRKDIKELYWRIGLISGGTAVVTSVATSMFMRALK